MLFRGWLRNVSRLGLFGMLMVPGLSLTVLQGAEIIERVGSDTRLSGEVTGVDKNVVKFKNSKGENVEIPVAEVIDIQWTGEPVDLKTARSDEAAGRLPKALEGYKKAATENKAPNPLVKADIQYFTARVAAKLALGDPGQADAAIKSLAEFKSQNGDSRHLFETADYLVQLSLLKGDAAGVKAAAEDLNKATSNAYKMAARIALGRASLLENQPAEAQKEFSAVAEMAASGAMEESRKLEAQLGLAQVHSVQKQYPEAIKLLDEVVTKSPPEDSRLQAEAFLRLGEAHAGAGNAKDALLSYLYVDVVTPQEKSFHPEALYHLSQLWKTAQQPERAADAADRLLTDYPNSAWATKLKNAPAS